jgi:hypothetical protein
VALRKAAERTREDLWQLIGRTLDRFQAQECRNFLTSSKTPAMQPDQKPL